MEARQGKGAYLPFPNGSGKERRRGGEEEPLHTGKDGTQQEGKMLTFQCQVAFGTWGEGHGSHLPFRNGSWYLKKGEGHGSHHPFPNGPWQLRREAGQCSQLPLPNGKVRQGAISKWLWKWEEERSSLCTQERRGEKEVLRKGEDTTGGESSYLPLHSSSWHSRRGARFLTSISHWQLLLKDRREARFLPSFPKRKFVL